MEYNLEKYKQASTSGAFVILMEEIEHDIKKLDKLSLDHDDGLTESFIGSLMGNLKILMMRGELLRAKYMSELGMIPKGVWESLSLHHAAEDPQLVMTLISSEKKIGAENSAVYMDERIKTILELAGRHISHSVLMSTEDGPEELELTVVDDPEPEEDD